ncbi:MAG: glycosyltransferase family 4 protein [Candidatus Andersenbacteria bacterium]
MRIVHTCLRYPPATGGVETYVREIVERSRDVAAGRDVRVLTSKMRTHGPITELDPELLVDDPPYIQRLHHAATPVYSYPRLQALSYYLKHHAPDIVHGYGFWYQPADVTARFAHQHQLPFIFHPMYYENDVRRKLSWQLYKKLWGERTFELADVVVVISPYEQQLIERAGFPVKRFALIPPGVELKHYQHPRENPYHKRTIHGKIILVVGRIATSKGIDELLSILPQLRKEQPEAQVVIIGEDFGAKVELTAQAERLGVSDIIHWWGKVDQEELLGAYQHADVFVHLSHYEAFGIVLIEAMAAGLPVVARNVAAVPYVVPDQQAGLLFNDAQELQRALIALLTNPTLSTRLKAAGIERVAKHFTWDSSIKKVLALYHDLRP